jgi:type II secretory pathway pseudopilin PulG
MLVVALMAVFALAVITPIKFEMQRDQEQEMIHRGVQYSRAIRGYYKKFGRYPTKLEDLDNTNNLRYLRKRYKDPLTGQDFKLLHYGDQGVTLAGGIGGALIPGASPAGAPTGLSGTSSSSSSSAFGGSGFGSSSFGSSGANGSGVNSSGVFSQSSGPGGNSNSAFGANSNSQTPAGQAGTDAVAGQDPSQAGSQTSSQGSSPAGSSAFGSSSSNGQVIGGGPIVGVASISKKASIREFNKKKKYNDWQFVYDPTADHGGLITTPYQPMAIQGMGSQGIGTPAGQNGNQPGSPGSSPFGQSSTFGNSPNGFGNNPSPGGTTQPTQPPASPQQQQ